MSSQLRLLSEYLTHARKQHPDQIAYTDGTISLSVSETGRIADAVSTALLPYGSLKPVAVLMPRDPLAIACFFGVLGSGNYYIPLDEEMGAHRIRSILEKINPLALIAQADTDEIRQLCAPGCPVLDFERLSAHAPDEAALARASARQLPSDPAYVIFTSGSTGVPKGIVASHENVISYLEASAHFIRPQPDTVMGMQAALCVDFSLWEIWFPLLFGCKTVILPKVLFLSPLKLVEFMTLHGVNMIHWVASALVLVSSLGVLKKTVPAVSTVLFGGEALPAKQLSAWREALPDARFINCYGPTETTGYAAWYEIPGDFPKDKIAPVGKPLANSRIFLLSEEGAPVQEADVSGEVFIAGQGVAQGYFSDPAGTAAAFVQNPLNETYREIVYRTGDLAKYDAHGNLIFCARKDRQIKRMGYRIELPEIEAAALRIASVDAAFCVYVQAKDRIVLFYLGAADSDEVFAQLCALLPGYMRPSRFIRLDAFPKTQSGKVDRRALEMQAEGL